MRRIVLAVLVLLGPALVAQAKDYQSSFRFTFSAPDAWLIMTKQELTTNPVFASADPGVKAKVESGSVEYFFNRVTSDATFTDIIDVKRGPGKIPSGPEAVKAECEAYAKALAKATGRTLALTTCEDRDVGASKAFYVEGEGPTAGTVRMQYQLTRPDGKLLFVTGTCKQGSLDKFRPDFEAIVRSIKFN
ncbi:MAG TPA: hypothetical protein VMT45_04430 [Thermoanaerobaculaceae bacterium]|jgi:hypothetical protein|nr:hypothetical protein [Thermoanaerobaculaceae bacterium]